MHRFCTRGEVFCSCSNRFEIHDFLGKSRKDILSRLQNAIVNKIVTDKSKQKSSIHVDYVVTVHQTLFYMQRRIGVGLVPSHPQKRTTLYRSRLQKHRPLRLTNQNTSPAFRRPHPQKEKFTENNKYHNYYWK